MLEPSAACPGPNYSHIVHYPEGNISLAPQLNYITDIVLELKVELAKIKTELKDLKNQLTVVHLSLINELLDIVKKLVLELALLSSINIPFKTQKIKFHFLCKR